MTESPPPFVPWLPRYGEPWWSDEIEHLRTSFRNGTDLDTLSRLHGRTRAAIASKLVAEKLLYVDGNAYWKKHSEPWCTFVDTYPKPGEVGYVGKTKKARDGGPSNS